ncbi:MAG TPA: urea ABC transporter permease subunit UrtB [Stellaceae bacterium]|jgi:urea transport system permease protein|nr:urea ABC transporter permease subunit UrtB [Stellaceae bacterium]
MTVIGLFRVVLLAILVALAGPPAPAQADDYGALIAALGSDTFAEKEKAITGLGTLGDTRAVPVLQAMSEDRLRTGPNGQVVIVAPDDANKLTDAATGQPLPDLAAKDTNRIIVNNRLRGSIEAALGGLTLFSTDRDTRLAAARDALKHPSAEVADRLKKAIAAEHDGEVRAAMQKSLYAAQLAAGGKDEQLAAIGALAGDTDPRVKSLLDEFAARPNLDPDLRKATDAAIASVNRRLQMVGVVANLFQGISLGSILLLAAIGLAITFGVMGVINMAHGEMIMVGAYVAYVVQQFFRAYLPPSLIDGYLIVAVPVAFLFAGALGVILERCLIRFLYGRPLETLLATWGVSLILQQAVRSVFGSPNKEVSNPSWMTGGFDPVGGFTVTWNRVYIIVFCFVVLGALALILNRTRFGLYMRAVTQNRDMARAMGIRTARVDALTFGLGSGIAGMAGVALSQIGNVSPNLGQIYIVDSFLVVVFGGVGNLMGTLIGALSLGVVNKVLEPFAGAILGKIVVLVAIILFIQRRPRGLFALKGRTAET